MDIREHLIFQVVCLGKVNVLSKLGYKNIQQHHYQRLEEVIKSPVLGLDSSQFDFKYSSEEYLIRLAEICSIPESQFSQYLAETKLRVSQTKEQFRPYIFVDTGFKRKTQPVFVLAACENLRFVILDKQTNDLLFDEKLALLRNLIRSHMEKTEGVLLIWGKIERYFFVYDGDRALELSVDGELIKHHDYFEPTSSARISVKGKTLKFT